MIESTILQSLVLRSAVICDAGTSGHAGTEKKLKLQEAVKHRLFENQDAEEIKGIDFISIG